jgi:hypothetical protein
MQRLSEKSNEEKQVAHTGSKNQFSVAILNKIIIDP